MASSSAQQKYQEDLRKRLSSAGNFLTAPFKNVPNALREVATGLSSLRPTQQSLQEEDRTVVKPSQADISRSKLTGGSALTTIGPATPSNLPKAQPRVTTGNPSATSPTQPNRSAFVERVASAPASAPSGFQSTLDPNDPAAIGGALMNRTAGTQVQAPPAQPIVPKASQTVQEAPRASTALPGADAAYKDAYTQYIQSLAPGKGSTAARKKYLDFIQSREMGMNKIADQPIPLGLNVGQQAALTRQTAPEASRLQGDVELAQGAETAAQQQAKARLDFEQGQLDREEARRKAESEASKPIEVGGRLVNPITGDIVYEPPAGMGESKVLSPGQVIVDAQGNVIARNDSTTDKFTSVSPGSTIIDSQGRVVYTAPERAGTGQLTADQAKNAGFKLRADEANDIFDTLEPQLMGMNQAGYLAYRNLPNLLQPPFIQQQLQAERNFINAILRRESGAAIAPSEFDSATKQYFPMPGDSPEVLAQKRANRATTIQGLDIGAGGTGASREEYELDGVIYVDDGSGNYVPKA